MIQVLQIVKELVTPSWSKAAAVKAGRNMLVKTRETVRALRPLPPFPMLP